MMAKKILRKLKNQEYIKFELLLHRYKYKSQTKGEINFHETLNLTFIGRSYKTYALKSLIFLSTKQ